VPFDRERLILRPAPVIETISKLLARILERFGNCGLSRVCAQLLEIAKEDTQRAIRIGRSYIWLRVLVLILIAGGLAVLGWILTLVDLTQKADSVYSFAQGIEAAANLTILVGAAVIFLLRLEERLKRRRALAALHELRSIIHVIDMHQLTKDPSKFIVGASTPSSPPLLLNQFQMTRYLDYCSEMLSLTSKVGVLFGQSLEDPAVAEVVSDVERVAAGLSQKIWQKIIILQELRMTDAGTSAFSDVEGTAIPGHGLGQSAVGDVDRLVACVSQSEGIGASRCRGDPCGRPGFHNVGGSLW
jgi:hypothetical protein